MKKIFLSFFLSAVVIISFAQTNCSIKKAYAFYTVSVPGAQMADENGNPVPPIPFVNRYIYIEWSGAEKPEIETVLYNNKPLSTTVTAIDSSSVIPGENFGNNREHKITVKKCNNLWKIDLQALANNSMPNQDCKNIIIKTKGTKNTCEFKPTKDTQLMTLSRYLLPQVLV